MTLDCPSCHSSCTEVLESRLCTNGTRRRRHLCQDCAHRWTSWDGPRPRPEDAAKTRRAKPTRKNRSRLTPEQVRFALLRTELSNSKVACEFDCSAETIRQIRNGMLYSKVHPELLRPNAIGGQPVIDGPNCLDCGHWRSGRCSFGFPDPLLEGLTFAAECHLYAA